MMTENVRLPCGRCANWKDCPMEIGVREMLLMEVHDTHAPECGDFKLLNKEAGGLNQSLTSKVIK